MGAKYNDLPAKYTQIVEHVNVQMHLWRNNCD